MKYPDMQRIVLRYLTEQNCTGAVEPDRPTEVSVTSPSANLGHLTLHADGDVTHEGMTARGAELSEGARRQLRWARLFF